MLTFKVGCSGPGGAAAEMARYKLKSENIPQLQKTLAQYYGASNGASLEAGALAIPMADMDPLIAKRLGIDPTRPLTETELAHIFNGKRADGTEIEGKRKSKNSYIDLTFSAPKSLSVAIVLAPTERERLLLDKCHTDAVASAMKYVAEEIGTASIGDNTGNKDPTRKREEAKIAVIMIDHYIARPTYKLAMQDGSTRLIPVAKGDPQRHTHVTVPNVAVTASGRVTAVHQQGLKQRVHEFGAIYQAFLATNLRRLGVNVELDSDPSRSFNERMAHLTDVPRDICQMYSKRTNDGEKAARDVAAEAGIDFDTASPEAKAELLGKAVNKFRKGKEKGGGEYESWLAQAAEVGYRHRSILRPGQEQGLRPDAERHMEAYSVALPMIDEHFQRRAVIEGSIPRVAVAKALIQTGIRSAREVNTITAAMRSEGVQQDGQMTKLHWAHTDRSKRFAKVTTQLSMDQENEAIGALQAAAADKSVALSPEAIERAVARTVAEARANGEELDFTKGHGAAQREFINRMGASGRAAVGVGLAGAGKSTAIRCLLHGWHEIGQETWGVTVAWRQTAGLKEAGVGKSNRKHWEPNQDTFRDAGLQAERTVALNPFIKRLTEGKIQLNHKSTVIVDEIALVGTKQLLELTRLQVKHGFHLVAIGDDLQCQAQPLDAKILTPSGFRLMGDLAVGDLITTPTGEAVKVNRVWPQGEKEIYRITFSDGRKTECCLDHLWKVWKEQNLYSDGSHATRRVINRGDRYRILPLSEIVRWFDDGLIYTKHAAVPLVKPLSVELPEQDLPIPPYALGLLLGDGHFTHSTPHFSTADSYLINRLMEDLPDYELILAGKYDYRIIMRDRASHFPGRSRVKAAEGFVGHDRHGGRREILLTYEGETKPLAKWAREQDIDVRRLHRRIGILGWTVGEALNLENRQNQRIRQYSPLLKALISLGLDGTRSQNKFIPEIYKSGSVDQRLNVLRGLLDTDGTVGQGGTYAVYYTTSEALASDVRDIARSLGAIATISTREKFLDGAQKLRQYYINISHPDITQFFCLPRKVALTRQGKHLLRLKIKSIESIGPKQARCITIDHQDQLYVTDDYIVTHNSISAGATIDLARRAFGKDNVPELLSSVRQFIAGDPARTQRERDTAMMWRDGKAAEALARKDQDGTLKIVPGGYNDAIKATVDLYLERKALNADNPKYSLGISVPTNADGRAIGEEILRRRQASGEVRHKDLLQLAACDQDGNAYTMTIARGSHVRLFDRVRGKNTDGKWAIAGVNGTVLEVLSATRTGMTVRKPSGKVATIAWDDLRKDNGPVRLSYGDAVTIDARQSETVTEHITAMPSGSSGVNAFRAYTSESRHRETAWIVSSAGAEQMELKQRWPLGDPRNQETDQDKIKAAILENMARNLSQQDKKELAVDFVDRAVDLQTGRVAAGEASWLHMPPAEGTTEQAASSPDTAVAPGVAVGPHPNEIPSPPAAVRQDIEEIPEWATEALPEAPIEAKSENAPDLPPVEIEFTAMAVVAGWGDYAAAVDHLMDRWDQSNPLPSKDEWRKAADELMVWNETAKHWDWTGPDPIQQWEEQRMDVEMRVMTQLDSALDKLEALPPEAQERLFAQIDGMLERMEALPDKEAERTMPTVTQAERDAARLASSSSVTKDIYSGYNQSREQEMERE